MTPRRRALISQTRVPEIDRDRGSQRVDGFIRWLVEQGWSVTFLAAEEDGDHRHADRLRQSGVATFVGYDHAEDVVAAGEFELALLAFWEPASQLLPVLRALSPETRVIIDSIDLHFLRDARRVLGVGAPLDERFGAKMAAELSTYREADAVLTVSEKEATLLGDFMGPERIRCLPLGETIERSPVPFEERRGILFVGNFRHLPNGEAVEYLCRDVVPRLSPTLLAAHPVSIVGSRLSDAVLAHGRGLPDVRMVGWVPSIVPYLQQARVSVVPLLHGAGVKGKLIESLTSGTPVVTTSVGAEGTTLRHGEEVLIADTPEGLAGGLAQLLTDPDQWQRLADTGHDAAAVAHDSAQVRRGFLDIVEEILSLPPRSPVTEGRERARRRELAYVDTRAAVTETLGSIGSPGATILVASKGDDALVSLEGRTGVHFPQAADGKWAGYHPADSESAIRHLEAQRDRGARYFAVPSTQFWWLHHYRELTRHLESRYRRIHSGEHLVVFELDPVPARPRRSKGPASKRERVLALGTHRADRSGPPPSLVEQLDASEHYSVTQRWRAAGAPAGAEPDEEFDADWLLLVDDRAVLPDGFLDDFVGALAELAPLGIERAQPAHIAGPEAGPPVTERLHGVFAREVESTSPLPVLELRAGAGREGPGALVDAVPIGLAEPIDDERDPLAFSNVRDVFVDGDTGPRRAVERSQAVAAPRISVLVATYDRPELLRGCLAAFCDQTLPVSDFEVVVVDDGTPGASTRAVLDEFASRLPLTSVGIGHAGRSAAKNLAILLARGELVLFFDDDDRPAPDLLQQHVSAHERHPSEATAVLGHTGWDAEAEVTPLMHYLTDVDQMLFAYGNIDGREALDWRGFWEGRISSKRSLHLRHGLHDQRLPYSIDVEMGWRLARQGLEVVYEPEARSVMARPITFEEFCRRHEAKGRAQAAIASLHDDPEIRAYTHVDDAAERWREARPQLPRLKARVHELEQAVVVGGEDAESALAELHVCYRDVFQAHNAKGVAEGLSGATSAPTVAAAPREPPPDDSTSAPIESGRNGSEEPALTVTMPVWSRTVDLAEMATRTVERVWEVARLPTEIVVVDNGSPVERPLRARVHRFEENRGVASGWNAGIELARAPVIAVLNSDCQVEPGWDEALYEAATTGRRIAFPYTDHCDGLGFRQPDQAGTAGWCFMLTRAVYDEIGTFDERFNPAYGEDTDYWHRAWELGVELSPVPGAQVTHARRTSVSAEDRSEWLLTAHRYIYGWKHGVDPMAAPPYYNREIIEYHCTQSPLSRATTT